jgi:hypothetical protein
MFQDQGAIFRGGLSIQKNIDPTHQSSYLVAFTKVIKILNIKIRTYIKLIIILCIVYFCVLLCIL